MFRSLIPASTGLLFAFLCACHPAQAQADTLTAEQAIADLDRLYEGLIAAEADLFAETPKSVFDARYRELSDRLARSVSRAELHAELQRFVALARHSHTRIDQLNPGWSNFLEAGGKVFPLSFQVNHGEVIVVSAPANSGIEPGDRILAMDGETNPIWLARFKRNISAETPALAYAMMSGGAPYFAWLEYGARESFLIRLQRGDQTIELTLKARSFEDFLDGDADDPGFDLYGREARLLHGNVAYLRPGAFYNLDAESPADAYAPESLDAYKTFIDEAFAMFLESGAEHLVLDLRDNGGGDVSFSDPVIAWFADQPFRFTSDFRVRVSAETIASNQKRLESRPDDTESISAKLAEVYAAAEIGDLISYEMPFAYPRDGARFTGQVHVLVNRYSYSNAVTTAALIQDYEFGTIYGEPTRDMATTYGAMEHFSLPNSGFVVGYPKAHIIRPNRDERSHPVTPDVLISVPSVRGSADIMLDRVTQSLLTN